VACLISAVLAIVVESVITARQNFSHFDDEGVLLIGFRQMAEGRRLYDEIYSFYGPLYYLVYAVAYGLLDGSLTHDGVRLVAALAWMVCAGLAGWLAFALSGSVITGTLAGFVVHRSLTVTVNSPGHPELLCLILFFALGLVAARVDRRPGNGTFLLAGAGIAGALLVKVNVGVFLGAGWAILLAGLCVPRRIFGAVSAAISIAALALPTALMMPLMHLGQVPGYAVLSTATIGAALIAWHVAKPARYLPPARLMATAAGFAVAVSSVVVIVSARGTTLPAMLEMTLFQTARFVRNWYILTDIGAAEIVASTGALACAGVWALLHRSRRNDASAEIVALALKAAFAGASAVVMIGVVLPIPFPEVLTIRRAYWLLLPFCWLVLVPTGDAASPLRFGRAVLGLCTAIFSLYSFPVNGHQSFIAFTPLAVLACVVARDVVAAGRWKHPRVAGRPVWLSVAAACIAAALFGGAMLHALARSSLHARYESLDLPGATTIRTRPEQAETLRWVTARIADCAASYSLPGLMSFHIWVGHRPATALNINHPLAFLTDDQQRQVVAELSAVEGLCLVVRPSLLAEFDRGQIARNPPLLAYVEDNYVAVAERGGYVVMRRRSETD
jgi:hypothetical protein